MTKVFFDCEFTGLHQNTTLISIGMVAESGETFYAEAIDYNRDQVDNWILENIISHLVMITDGGPSAISDKDGQTFGYGKISDVAEYVKAWLGKFDSVEMWGDVLAYDWVLFCQLFGGGVECLPRNTYYIPFDLATVFKLKGIDPDISRIDYSGLEDSGYRHNSFYDAKVIRACYNNAISGKI